MINAQRLWLGNHGYICTFNKYEYSIDSYIGEGYIIPKLLVNAVRLAIGRKPLKVGLMYYFGTPTDRLKKIFGYKCD